MRSERASGSGLSERRGGTEGKAWGNDSDRCGEQELKEYRCAGRDVMIPLDLEPSNGAEPQQLLGDCAALGNNHPAGL